MKINKKKKFIPIIIVITILVILLSIFYYFIYLRPNSDNTAINSENTSNTKKDDSTNSNIPKINNETIVTSTGAKINIVTSYDKSMFKGKKSLVFFWASWCSHCLEEMEVIKESMKEYSNKGYNIYAISHDNELEKLVAFMENENIQFDVYFDIGKIIRFNLDPKANTLPLLYVINEDVSIGKKFDGATTKPVVYEFVQYIEKNK